MGVVCAGPKRVGGGGRVAVWRGGRAVYCPCGVHSSAAGRHFTCGHCPDCEVGAVLSAPNDAEKCNTGGGRGAWCSVAPSLRGKALPHSRKDCGGGWQSPVQPTTLGAIKAHAARTGGRVCSAQHPRPLCPRVGGAPGPGCGTGHVLCTPQQQKSEGDRCFGGRECTCL